MDNGLSTKVVSGNKLVKNDLQQLYDYLDEEIYLEKSYHFLYDEILQFLISIDTFLNQEPIFLFSKYLQLFIYWRQKATSLKSRAYINTYL